MWQKFSSFVGLYSDTSVSVPLTGQSTKPAESTFKTVYSSFHTQSSSSDQSSKPAQSSSSDQSSKPA